MAGTEEPSEVFARRVGEVQERSGVSNSDLGRDLAALGFPTLGRDALREIKRGERSVTINEALAICWALGVAPMHMLVPFEDEQPVTVEGRTWYPPTTELRVGAGVEMMPVEARSWLAGVSMRYVDDVDEQRKRERRFYFDQVPPAQRDAVDKAAGEAARKAAREGHPDVITVALPVSTWVALEAAKEES